MTAAPGGSSTGGVAGRGRPPQPPSHPPLPPRSGGSGARASVAGGDGTTTTASNNNGGAVAVAAGSTSNNSSAVSSSSLVPGNPSFRSFAINAVAVVPLLSSSSSSSSPSSNQTTTTTRSEECFRSLMDGISRFASGANNTNMGGPGGGPSVPPLSKTPTTKSSSSSYNYRWSDDRTDVLLAVPHSQLTRPGDWRYDSTPMKSFSWNEGCHRMVWFDGRTDDSASVVGGKGGGKGGGGGGATGGSRRAVDRLSTTTTSSSSSHRPQQQQRDWVELIPSRGTAAIVGVLSVKDCASTDDLRQAEHELNRWARAYDAGKKQGQEDPRPQHVVTRMFVFDSFDEECQKRVDLSSVSSSSSSSSDDNSAAAAASSARRPPNYDMVAFPPIDNDNPVHAQMMHLHLNVVVNDLAVAIFRSLEQRIRRSDDAVKAASKFAVGGGGGVVGVGVGIGGALVRGAANAAAGGGGAGVGSRNKPLGPSAIVQTAPGSGGGGGGPGGSVTDTASVADSVSSSLSSSTMGGGGGGGSDRGERGGGGGEREGRGGLLGLAARAKNAMNKSITASDSERSSGNAPSAKAVAAVSAARLVTPLDGYCAGGGDGGSGGDGEDAQSSSTTSASSAASPTAAVAVVDYATLTVRDLESARRRDAARREKHGADLSLLAGSPIDAFERYTRSAEMAKACHDPLWYASSLIGCAASYVAMADVGGHGADSYLNENFQLPEEIMALAIAQGAAALGGGAAGSGGVGGSGHGGGGGSGGGDAGDKDGKSVTVDRTKTTLPAAVFALAEEALSILCRHAKLMPLYAELVLDMAEYALDAEESHLRCRWGEGGPCCYAGDVATGDLPRWERTTVSQLELKGAADLLAADSIVRCRRFSELCHRAASAGGLDPRSRADVAAACARMCLRGMKASQWDGTSRDSGSRLRLPRKAAFFTTVAAEAMSQCTSSADAARRAASLWLAASHLYSREGNAYHNGASKYAWATLRASALQGLAQQSDQVAAEVAAELLLVLLSEISPNRPADAIILGQLEDESKSIPSESRHSNKELDEESEHSRRASTARTADMSSDASEADTLKTSRQLKGRHALQSRLSFAQVGPSPFALSQSKWLEGDPVPDVQLPLVDPAIMLSGAKEGAPTSLASALIPLNSVITDVKFATCAMAQSNCIASLSNLRAGIPTSSGEDADEFGLHGGSRAAGALPGSLVPPPLEVMNAKIIKSESHLLLERTKAQGYSAKLASSSMATFFNPYANKKSDSKGKIKSTLVAEGEERIVSIEFGNRLSVPLEVPSAQLEFDERGKHRIEAPPLSFVVPAKTKSFAVHFPLSVVCSKTEQEIVATEIDTSADNESAPDNKPPSVFDLVGLRVTCLSRSFLISFRKKESAESTRKNTEESYAAEKHLPEPASTYHRSSHTKPKKEEEELGVRLESVPAQPNLLVSFSTSQTPLDDEATVPVHLSDGEIYTIPPFRLENDFGRSGMGKLERLQILGVGLPGLPEETLFDTDELAAAREDEEDVLTDSDSNMSEEDFEEMMECDGLPPLKMKAIVDGLSLKSINDRSKCHGEGSIVTFQVAATHDMGKQLANGGNVRIRFRYRGNSPNPATEIWRKREVSLRIIRVKGPRISSLTFRSDLSWGSSYSELCATLAQQKALLDSRPKWGRTSSSRKIDNVSGEAKVDAASTCDLGENAGDSSILTRVGMDQGVHVASNEVVVLMAVANETNSTIILSNRKGLVGGFEGNPMTTVKVTSGVSVKIPVVIPRIDRVDENGEPMDIATELVARTALQWESEAIQGVDAVKKMVRTGRVRIPSRCLREIIDEHAVFAPRICTPPLAVNVSLGQKEVDGEAMVSLGSPMDVSVDASIHDWVSREVVENCTITLEFCCAVKEASVSALLNQSCKPYVWCGQLRRTIKKASDESLNHRARICFFQPGVFIVSACAKICGRGKHKEETWWAPVAKVVRVEKESQ